jgi:hypothetical protein
LYPLNGGSLISFVSDYPNGLRNVELLLPGRILAIRVFAKALPHPRCGNPHHLRYDGLACSRSNPYEHFVPRHDTEVRIYDGVTNRLPGRVGERSVLPEAPHTFYEFLYIFGWLLPPIFFGLNQDLIIGHVPPPPKPTRLDALSYSTQPFPLLAVIHRSAWNKVSPKFKFVSNGVLGSWACALRGSEKFGKLCFDGCLHSVVGGGSSARNRGSCTPRLGVTSDRRRVEAADQRRRYSASVTRKARRAPPRSAPGRRGLPPRRRRPARSRRRWCRRPSVPLGPRPGR